MSTPYEFIQLEKEYNKFYYKHIADIYDFKYSSLTSDIEFPSQESYILYPLEISDNFIPELFQEKNLLMHNDHTYHTYKYVSDDKNSINKVKKIHNILEQISEINDYSKLIDQDDFYSLLINADNHTPNHQPEISYTNTPLNDEHTQLLTIIDMLGRFNIKNYEDKKSFYTKFLKYYKDTQTQNSSSTSSKPTTQKQPKPL